MREILFRGKRIDNGEWIEGGIIQGVPHELWQNEGRAYILVFPQYLSRPNLYEVDPATVGQYTGLTDKSGKKIFEGDIVKGLFLFGLPVRGVASFKDGAFGLAWLRGDVDEFSAFTSMCNVEYEIIGNIHDNPELLGGAEDG